MSAEPPMPRTLQAYGSKRAAWLVALGTAAALSSACKTRTPATTPRAVGYLKGQLHLHSSRSGDSHTPPEDVVRWYREHGYDFIVLTDHNRAAPRLSSQRPLVFSGAELTQNLPACSPPPTAPDERCAFHVNALFIRPDAEGLDPWRFPLLPDRRAAYRQALLAAERAGALAQLNHPNFHFAANAELLIALAREDGLRFFEVANGSRDAGNDGDATHPSTEELWDRVLSAGAWLYGTATDDAHHYDDAAEVAARGEPVFVGERGFVMVRAAPNEPSIRAALLRGDFYASNGVLLARAEVSSGALVVEVASPGAHSFRFIGTGGKLLAQREGRAASFPLAQAPPGYLRAVVQARDGRKAWVQPVRVP
jgi:hypothetical protein